MASEELCLKALDEHEDELSADPRVQAIGVVAGEGEPVDSENCAVAVYVESLAADETSPALPESLEVELGGARHRVPVRVIEQGPLSLEAPDLEPAPDDEPDLESEE